MKQGTPILLIIAYGFLWLVMFILPAFSLPSYSIWAHTTSELGAQHTPNAWIMNLSFFLLGISSLLSGWSYYKRFWFHKIALLAFGLGLMLVAFFQHAPIDKNIAFDVREDQLHSLLASIIGFAFTLLAISTGFILQKKGHKLLAFTVGILATLLSILIFQIPDYRGIWQRLIFIFSFGWMIYLFYACPLKED